MYICIVIISKKQVWLTCTFQAPEKKMSEDIARMRRTRKTYLRSISNQDNHILDIIWNYSANQQIELNLKGKKNSLTEKIENVNKLDTKMLDSSKAR